MGLFDKIFDDILGFDPPKAPEPAQPTYYASSGATGKVGRMKGESGSGDLTLNTLTEGVRTANGEYGTSDNIDKYYQSSQIQRRERALTSFD